MTRADGLLHPVALGAIALLVLNDHLLKYSAPGVITGKLSDAAGMVFFPLLLVAVFEVFDRRRPFRPSRTVLILAALLTGVVFGSTNLFPWAAGAYRFGLGVIQWPFRLLLAMQWVELRPVQHTLDPWDVVAVPFVGVAVAIGWRRGGDTPPPEAC